MFGLNLESLAKNFSPRLGLKTLRELIIDRVGHPVEHYDVHFYATEKKIDFLIYLPQGILTSSVPKGHRYENETRSHLYNFKQGEKIATLVEYFVTNNLKAGMTLDYAVIKYRGESSPIEIESYVTKDGQKLKHPITL